MAIDISDIARMAAENAKGETWTSLPCKVITRSGNFVDVEIGTRRPVDTAEGGHGYEDLPIVPNVPIAWPQAGACSITFPVATGDTGLILFATHSLAEWRRGDAPPVNPGDLRTHHLAHAIFLPQLSVDSLAPASVEDAAMVLTAPAIKLGSKDATHAAADAVLVKAELDQIALALSSLFAPSGGGPVTGNLYTVASDVGCAKVKLE